MDTRFYKMELSGDQKGIQAKEMFFVCVDGSGKVLALMNKPALDLTDERYLKEARQNVDFAYDKAKKEGLTGIKNWILNNSGKANGEITTTEISSQEWIRARAQIHKCEKIALVCQLEKTLNKNMLKPRKYEDADDLVIKELRLAKVDLLTKVANRNEFSEYKITKDEARMVLAHSILKEKYHH